MKTAKKIIAVLMTVLMVFSAVSVVTYAAAVCNHNIGIEGSTLREYSRENSTCSQNGRVYYECTNCDFTTSDELPLDSTKHEFGEWQEVVAPTCAKDGEQIRYCEGKNCRYLVENGVKYSEKGVIPATKNHVYADEAELAFWWTVSGIGVGDTYKSWKIVTLPTCFDFGEATTVCTKCGGAEITVDLDKHSYNYIENKAESVEANCVSTGSCAVVCSVCNANATLVIPVDEENHSWRYEVTTEPTCTEEGLMTAYCHRHGELEGAPTEVIPAKGHSFKNYIYQKNATCKADGTEIAKCENKGCKATDERVAKGTKLSCLTQWKFKSSDATCETGGEADLICAGCKKVYDTKTFAAGEHPEVRKVTYPATCLKDGYEDTVCTLCGVKTAKRVELKSSGHNEKKIIKRMPSCMEAKEEDRYGIDVYLCQTCGNSREVKVPYTHRYVNISPAVEATCTKAGKTAHNKCIDCGYEEISQTIPALGHKDTDNDGCCNVCYMYFVENSQGQVVDCKCLCHNPDGIAKLFFKFYNFFCKLFGTNQVCGCGKLHYEKAGIN